MFECDLVDDAGFFAPPRTDEEIARLIAGDPEPPDPDEVAASRRERVAELLAAGQSAPVDGVLVGHLDALDPAELDQEQRLALVVGQQRAANHAQAMRGRAVAAFAADTTAVFDLHPRAVAAGDVGSALALGRGAADSLVDTSVALADRLPDTAAAAQRGDLSWDKATTLAGQTAMLTDDQTRTVEERVLAKAPGRTPARHRDAVRRAVDRVDPDGADERRRQAKKDVALIRTHHGDGIGELFARMPSEQLDTVWTGAEAWARRAKAAGDPRTVDQLRVGALFAWAESFLTHGDPTYCDQHCQPTLTDAPCDEGPDGDEPVNDGPDDDRPDSDGPHDDGPAPGPGDTHADTENETEPKPQAEPESKPEAQSETETETETGTENASRSGAPRRHGRPVRVGVIWDLTSLLGLTRHCGELLDSGATLPPGAMRDLIARGVRVRRMLIRPDDGELVDLTPRTWKLPGAAPPDVRGPGHGPPVTLGVILDTRLHTALTTGDRTDLDEDTVASAHAINAALDAAHPALRVLVDYPITAESLDEKPHAETPKPALAEFVALRDRHPTNPTAGCTAASAGDLDHTISRATGGLTIRDNLTAVGRRWHILKTHGHWTVRRHGRGWQWTSPTGRTYTTQPYDYRLGA